MPRSAREARQGAGSAVFAFFVFLFSFFLIRAPAPSWVSLARAVRAGKGGRWRKGGMGGNGGTLHKTRIVVQLATACCTKSLVLWRAVRRAIIAAQNGARALCAQNAPMSGDSIADSVPLGGGATVARRVRRWTGARPPTYQRNELMYTETLFKMN